MVGCSEWKEKLTFMIRVRNFLRILVLKEVYSHVLNAILLFTEL